MFSETFPLDHFPGFPKVLTRGLFLLGLHGLPSDTSELTSLVLFNLTVQTDSRQDLTAKDSGVHWNLIIHDSIS